MQIERNSPDRLCDTLLVEVHPRLQSVWCYVTLVQPVADKCRLTLEENSFTIACGECEERVRLTSHVTKLIVSSLLCVLSEGHSVVFRCNVELDQKYGSFKSGFVTGQSETSVKIDEAPLYSTVSSSAMLCHNCDNLLFKVGVRRFLPLPLGMVNSIDWYCNPQYNQTPSIDFNSEGPNMFYTSRYYFVNIKKLQGSTSIEEKCIYCSNCRSWLGTKEKDDTCLLWFNSVAVTNGEERFTSTAAMDLYHVITDAVKSVNVSKLVFTAHVDSHKTEYLLFWVLEKQMPLAFAREGSSEFDDNYKVLFRHELGRTDVVDKWSKDFNTTVVRISKSMMEELVKLLHSKHTILPSNFNSCDEFNISFVSCNLKM